MQFNQINSQAINKLLRVLQCLGLALWKVTFISSGNTQQRVIFSRYSLIFSILIVYIVICAIITQHSKLLVGFDTIYSSNLSVTVRHIHKMTFTFWKFLFLYGFFEGRWSSFTKSSYWWNGFWITCIEKWRKTWFCFVWQSEFWFGLLL